ncbi:MAG: hypothetical protein KKC66_03880 [Candidatus Omnitrophica bacterium]|nr:hypothetical protein [Candidatus Omnitrophota bacterium]MBU1933022.1 hypothetical protein [Candidatus Omnitrophota bacterium]
MENVYKFLRIGSFIFKVLAWASVVVGVISAIIIFVGGGTPGAPKTTGFIGLLLGLVYFFISYTASCVISVLLEIKNKVEKTS